MDTYLTIEHTSEGLYKEKGSRFIAYAYPVQSADEVKIILQQLKKEYYDARHVCYAYSLSVENPDMRSNDDGEPSGTGGRPILGVILSNKINNILIAVVRYFGGIKLGTSGLIYAYKTAAADAIANSQIVERIIELEFSLDFQYPQINEVMRVMKEDSCRITQQSFDLNCNILFWIRKNEAEKVMSRLAKIEGICVKKKV